MNENTRDTQFAGFARLLYEELLDIDGDVWIDTSNRDLEGTWKEIIARRAYDLVKHTLEVSEYEQPMSAVLPYVPDLTQWPEVSDE